MAAHDPITSLPPDPYSDDPWSWAFVIFRPIPGFPGYGADTDGIIWCCRGRGNARGAIGRVWRRMAQHINSVGYPQISMTIDGKNYTQRVHSLILKTFIGPRPSGAQACHSKPDRTCIRLSNLRWDSTKANGQDRIKHGTQPNGERHPKAKMSEEQVREVMRLLATGQTQESVGRRFGVTQSAISLIAIGKNWRHLS
jgi:HNH endonuclease